MIVNKYNNGKKVDETSTDRRTEYARSASGSSHAMNAGPSRSMEIHAVNRSRCERLLRGLETEYDEYSGGGLTASIRTNCVEYRGSELSRNTAKRVVARACRIPISAEACSL